MKTVLILNHHSMRNAGDAALLEVTLSALPGCRVLVCSGHAAEAELRALPVIPLPAPGTARGSLTAVWQACLRADLILSSSGNPFFSMGRVGKPFILSALQIWLALRAGKPLVVLPQTLGPFHRGWETALLRGLYRRAQQVWVRDEASLRLGQAWNLPRVAYAPDPSFLLAAAPPSAARAVLAAAGLPPGGDTLGISAVPRMTRTLDPAAIANFNRALGLALTRFSVENRVTPVFFAQCSGPTPAEDDRTAAQRVLAHMGSAASHAARVFQPLPARLLKACYGQMHALAAARLHAGLFAASMSVPALFAGYLPKTAWVLASLGMSQWGFPLSAVSESGLYRHLCDLWQTRAGRAAWLAGELPRWQAAAALPLAGLAD